MFQEIVNDLELQLVNLMQDLRLEPKRGDALLIGFATVEWKIRLRIDGRETGTAAGDLMTAVSEAAKTLGIETG